MHISFTAPTTNTDGTPITLPLSYVVSIDTVNPPVKAYPVPAANVAAAVAGVITVTSADLGFVPVAGMTYYIDVDAAEGSNVSVDTPTITYVYSPTPNPPTGFTVA